MLEDAAVGSTRPTITTTVRIRCRGCTSTLDAYHVVGNVLSDGSNLKAHGLP